MYADTAHGANPENALLKASESSCGLRFGEVTIPSFVILHARLGDERLPVGERAHYIRQVVMGFVFKCVANGEWCVLWDRQPVLRGELRVNVATRVVHNQGMIFKPEH